MDKLVFEAESYQIRGAAYEVYRELGNGFLESVYHECLSREFNAKGIPFVAQPEMLVTYKGQLLSQNFRPDFVCFDKIIIELKAVRRTADDHRAQLHNYLKVSGLPLGFLINFGHYPKVEIERVVISTSD